MIKKILSSAVLSVMLMSNAVNAETKIVPQGTSVDTLIAKQHKNIQHSFKERPELFRTSERTKDDVEMEKMLIENFKNNFVSQKPEFSQDDYDFIMNSYFVDALKTGNRNLADYILYESEANIDPNFKSKNPKNTPLMAVATSFSFDGGDIEYFIKLIEMGADPSEMTKTNNTPLMSFAATVDNYKIVLYLIMLGENPMHMDNLDFYPLDYAVRNDAHKTTIILTNVIDQYRKIILKDIKTKENK